MGPDPSGRGWCRMLTYRQGIGGLLRIAGKELRGREADYESTSCQTLPESESITCLLDICISIPHAGEDE